MGKNTLYYGDNLEILRNHIQDNSIDLIYLDPPFNSKADYNILYREPTGEASGAQITAFEDTWHWTEETQRTFQDIVDTAPPQVIEMMNAFRAFVGMNDMMAYLTMMCIRIVELRRVLKETGSIFLHCDPTASHYLKILMDAIFGKSNFRNEIIWDYTFRMMDLPKFFNRKHDIILFYAKSADNYFSMPKTEWTREEIIETRKQKIHMDEDGDECIWMPGGKGHSKNKLKKIKDIIKEGKAISDVWQIPIISSSAKERLGYPTQKPECLLERIILASSNENSVVLDPFCGCGTTMSVSQRYKRQWIGIDITHLSINLIKQRLKDTFNLEPKKDYRVIGEPEDLAGARELASQNRYQFQWWALALVNARPYGDKVKGSDTGIDGYIYFSDEKDKYRKAIVQVKSGGVSVKDLRDLGHVIEREKSEIGVLITLESATKPMIKEAFQKGYYNTDTIKGNYPRLQILTIEDLFAGKKPEIPTMISHIKKAQAVYQTPNEELNLE
jgi:site-specific DNA-methyltransferase (adenine-specific)